MLGVTVSRDLAHRPPGVLHLAVSLQVVDQGGRWLLQRRAPTKAMFANRWANTCCTHPGVDEGLEEAATRRVREELGLEVDQLRSAGAFVYRAADPESGLVEHEVDHVFVTVAEDVETAINPDEVSELAWVGYLDALELLASERGAPWAPEVLRRAAAVLDKR